MIVTWWEGTLDTQNIWNKALKALMCPLKAVDEWMCINDITLPEFQSSAAALQQPALRLQHR